MSDARRAFIGLDAKQVQLTLSTPGMHRHHESPDGSVSVTVRYDPSGLAIEAEAGKDRRGGQVAADVSALLNRILDWAIANRGQGADWEFTRCYTYPRGEFPEWRAEAEALAAAPQAAPADGALREALDAHERRYRLNQSYCKCGWKSNREPNLWKAWEDHREQAVRAVLAAADAAPERTLPSVETLRDEVIRAANGVLNDWVGDPDHGFILDPLVEPTRALIAALRAEAKE